MTGGRVKLHATQLIHTTQGHNHHFSVFTPKYVHPAILLSLSVSAMALSRSMCSRVHKCFRDAPDAACWSTPLCSSVAVRDLQIWRIWQSTPFNLKVPLAKDWLVIFLPICLNCCLCLAFINNRQNQTRQKMWLWWTHMPVFFQSKFNCNSFVWIFCAVASEPESVREKSKRGRECMIRSLRKDNWHEWWRKQVQEENTLESTWKR